MYRYAWEQTQMQGIEDTFRSFGVPDFDEGEGSRPAVIKLAAYPSAFVDTLLSNDTAHPLITMAHLDKKGYPLISIMGFSYLDGKIHVASRRNGIKQRRLREDSRCSFTYHNMIPRPDRIGFLTLVGRATVIDDPALASRHAYATQHKNYHDTDDDRYRREPGIAAMIAADREMILLDKVEAAYLMIPMPAGTASGRPTPLVSWRNDWDIAAPAEKSASLG